MKNSIENFKHLDNLKILEECLPSNKSFIIRIKEILNKQDIFYKNFYNKILLIKDSYEKIFENKELNFEEYILLTNIPFNIKSKTRGDFYEKFDDFLSENHDRFKKIFILYLNSKKKESYI